MNYENLNSYKLLTSSKTLLFGQNDRQQSMREANNESLKRDLDLMLKSKYSRFKARKNTATKSQQEFRIPKPRIENKYTEKEEKVKVVARMGPDEEKKLIVQQGKRKIIKKIKAKERTETASTTLRHSRVYTQTSHVPAFIAESNPVRSSTTKETVKEPIREPIFQKIVEPEEVVYQSYQNIKPAQFISSLDTYQHLDLPCNINEPDSEMHHPVNNRYSSSLFKFAQLGMMNSKDQSLENKQRFLKRHNKRHSHVHMKYELGAMVKMPINKVFGSDIGFKNSFKDKCLELTGALKNENPVITYFTNRRVGFQNLDEYTSHSYGGREIENDTMEDVSQQSRPQMHSTLISNNHRVALDPSLNILYQRGPSKKGSGNSSSINNFRSREASDKMAGNQKVKIIVGSNETGMISQPKLQKVDIERHSLLYPKQSAQIALIGKLDEDSGRSNTMNVVESPEASQGRIVLTSHETVGKQLINPIQTQPVPNKNTNLQKIFSNESLILADKKLLNVVNENNENYQDNSMVKQGKKSVLVKGQGGLIEKRVVRMKEHRFSLDSKKPPTRRLTSKKNSLSVPWVLTSKLTSFSASPENSAEKLRSLGGVFEIKVKMQKNQQVTQNQGIQVSSRCDYSSASSFDSEFQIAGPPVLRKTAFQKRKKIQTQRNSSNPDLKTKSEKAEKPPPKENPYESKTTRVFQAPKSTNIRSLKSQSSRDNSASSSRGRQRFRVQSSLAYFRAVNNQIQQIDESEIHIISTNARTSVPQTSLNPKPKEKSISARVDKQRPQKNLELQEFKGQIEKQRQAEMERHSNIVETAHMGKAYLLQPSYIKPFKKCQSMVQKVNQVVLLFDEQKAKEAERNVVSCCCVLNLGFVPDEYCEAKLKSRLLQELVKKNLKKQVKKKQLGNKEEEETLPFSQFIGAKVEHDHECSSSSDFDEEIERETLLRQLIKGTLKVTFGLPITFQVKQHLRLNNHLVKESNKLCDLSEFKIQTIHFYISTDPSELPTPKRHSYHKAIRFDYEKNGYGKEFNLNPVFKFTVTLPPKAVVSNKIYISIVGEKTCYLDITARLSVNDRFLEYQSQVKEPRLRQQLRQMNNDLTNFYKKHQQIQGEDSDNFLVKNIKSVKEKSKHEVKREAELRQMIVSQKNSFRQVSASKQRSMISSIMHTQRENDANKWENYRKQRSLAVERLHWMIKNAARIRIYISLIKLRQALVHLEANYFVWKKHNSDKINKLFISMKVRVAFKTRFRRKWGEAFETRLTKHIQRQFTVAGCFQYYFNAHLKRSRIIIYQLLFKRHFVENAAFQTKNFVKKTIQIQSFWKLKIINYQFRHAILSQQRFMKELAYMTWVYQKAEKMYVMNKKKVRRPRSEGGCGLNITQKQIKDTLQKLRDLKDNINSGQVFKRNQLVSGIMQRNSNEYNLDFIIWKFIQGMEDIKKLEFDTTVNIYDRNIRRIKMIEALRFIIKRLRAYQVKIFQLDSDLYENTQIIERDELYIIDPEYQEHQSSPVSQYDTPRSAKQSTQTVVKKKNDKGKEVKKYDYSRHIREQVDPTTFKKHENQRLAIQVLMSQFNDKFGGEVSDSNSLDESAREGILEYYRAIKEFPPFVQSVSRENLQRCVVKCSGLDLDIL